MSEHKGLMQAVEESANVIIIDDKRKEFSWDDLRDAMVTEFENYPKMKERRNRHAEHLFSMIDKHENISYK